MESLNEKYLKLHEPFYDISKKFHNKIALIYYKDEATLAKITYGELRQQCLQISNSILMHLEFSNLTYTFGIFCDPGANAIACMLGVLKHGSFIFLSPLITEVELISLINRINLKILIVNKIYLKKIPSRIDYNIIIDISIFDEDFMLISLNVENTEKVSNDLANYSLAYVICTSGSTGLPKIVYVPHECIVPNIKDFREIFEITDKDTVLNVSPFTFDPSIIDIFLSLSYGAQLITFPPSMLMKPKSLEIIFKNHFISILQVTPSLLRTLRIDFLRTYFKSTKLKVIAFGGESFPSSAKCREWFYPDCDIRVYNLYGLTEISCWASCHKVDMKSYISNYVDSFSGNSTLSYVSLGKPLTGLNIYLADDSGNVVTSGRGKIMISGKRNICYIQDSTQMSKVQEIIETGDIGYIDNTKIFFIERCDNVIKRNGCKIELSEIEMISKLLPDVSESAAIFHENKITLFISLCSFSSLNKEKLRIHTSNYLSSWKLPDSINILEQLPLNSNLKIDKQALMQCANHCCPISVCEKETLEDIFNSMCVLWKEYIPGYLRNNRDNFINLGGNSFQAVHLSNEIEVRFGSKNLPTLDTLLNGTFEDVCNLLRENLGNELNLDYSKGISDPDSTGSNITHSKSNLTLIKLIVASRGGQFLNGKKIPSKIKNEFKFKISWSVSLGKCIDSSPLVTEIDGKLKIYIGSHSHQFACIDGNGNLLWTRTLLDRIEASPTTSTDGKAIYIGCYNGHLYSLLSVDGKEMWKILSDAPIKSSVVVDSRTGNLIFGSYDKYLYSCNSCGKVLWKKKLSNGSIFSTPLIKDDFVYVGTLDGFLVCLIIHNGNFKWKIFIGKPIFSSLTLCSKGIIFGCTDNVIYCVNFDSKILWKYRTDGPVFSSPFVIENETLTVVGVGSHDHSLHLIDIYGKEIARYKFSSPIFSTPFIIPSESEDILIIFVCETTGLIHALSLNFKTGICLITKQIESLKLSGEIFSSPVIYNNKLYVGCRDNSLYCVEI